jgi:hypothetical protein
LETLSALSAQALTKEVPVVRHRNRAELQGQIVISANLAASKPLPLHDGTS